MVWTVQRTEQVLVPTEDDARLPGRGGVCWCGPPNCPQNKGIPARKLSVAPSRVDAMELLCLLYTSDAADD